MKIISMIAFTARMILLRIPTSSPTLIANTSIFTAIFAILLSSLFHIESLSVTTNEFKFLLYSLQCGLYLITATPTPP